MKSIRKQFMDKKRAKIFHKFLHNWTVKNKEYTSERIGINLLSLLTHSLIEIEEIEDDYNKLLYYKELNIIDQTTLVSKFIKGEITSDEVKKKYKEWFIEE